MTIKSQIINMVDLIPENELSVVLDVMRHFVPYSIDDIATAEDISAHEEALEEYIAGETVSHDAVDWA